MKYPLNHVGHTLWYIACVVINNIVIFYDLKEIHKTDPLADLVGWIAIYPSEIA